MYVCTYTNVYISASPLNIYAPLLNISAPLLNISAPLLNMSAPLLKMSAPLLNRSVPLLNISTSLLNISAPLLKMAGVDPGPDEDDGADAADARLLDAAQQIVELRGEISSLREKLIAVRDWSVDGGGAGRAPVGTSLDEKLVEKPDRRAR